MDLSDGPVVVPAGSNLLRRIHDRTAPDRMSLRGQPDFTRSGNQIGSAEFWLEIRRDGIELTSLWCPTAAQLAEFLEELATPGQPSAESIHANLAAMTSLASAERWSRRLP